MSRITKPDYKFDMLNVLQGLNRYTEIDEIMNRLSAYEDTGFTPSDIADHEEMFKAYRHICGGLSPEEVAKKINEASALKNDIADLRNFACQLCGRYKTAHEGSCDGCRWKKGE